MASSNIVLSETSVYLFLLWVWGDKEYGHWWHSLVLLPWYVPRCRKSDPPWFLQYQHSVNRVASGLIDRFFLKRYLTLNILAPFVFVTKHSCKRLSSLMFSWCWYWTNASKRAMLIDSSFWKAQVQFCRREGNSSFMVPAKYLIQQVTVLLGHGSAVNSLSWLFIQQAYGNLTA